MNDEEVARNALRAAERGASDDAQRLVASVPALMREARRRGAERGSPTLAQLAGWALPRLAAATAVVVLAATWVISRERAAAGAVKPPATIESVILGGSDGSTGDVVFDALLDVRRSDG
jgi:hypothetical protein